MKKLMFALFGLFCLVASAQGDYKMRSVAFTVADAMEMNAIPASKLNNGTMVYRLDVETVWVYDVDTWKDTGMGSAGDLGGDMTKAVYDADDDGLVDGVEQTAITTAYPNIDTDGSGTSVQATSPITLSGIGTVGSPYQVGFNDAAYMLLDGSRAFTGNVDFGNNLITNVEELLGNPDNNAGIGDDGAGDGSTYFNHANIARLSIANGSGNFWNGNLAFGNHFAIYPTTTFLGAEGAVSYEFDVSGTPTKDESVATKKYVDDEITNESLSYKGVFSQGTGNANVTYDLSQYRRIDLNHSGSAVTIDFSNVGSSIGEPVFLHITSTNVGGTVITFGLGVYDNRENESFSVTLAENESINLNFVAYTSSFLRCTNYPFGSGGTDNSLSEADQTISVADRTINLSGVSSVLNIENGSGTDITRFTKTALEVTAIENIGTLTDPITVSSPYQIYNNGVAGTTSVTNPTEGTVKWNGPTEEFSLYHDGAFMVLNERDITDDEFTTTTYTPTTSDLYKIIEGNNASTITVSEPTGSYSDGNYISLQQTGAGQLECDFVDWVSGSNIRTSGIGDQITIRYKPVARNGSNWAFSGGGESYTPDPINQISGLVERWDADKSATASGNTEGNLTGEIASYVLNVLGDPQVGSDASGKYWAYDGTGDAHTNTADDVALDLSPTSTGSIVVVTGPTVPTSSGNWFVNKGDSSGASGTQYGIGVLDADTQRTYIGGELKNHSTTPSTANKVVAATWDGTNIQFYVDTTSYEADTYTGTFTSAETLAIAARLSGTSQNTIVDIREVLIFNTEITTTDLQTIIDNHANSN